MPSPTNINLPSLQGIKNYFFGSKRRVAAAASFLILVLATATLSYFGYVLDLKKLTQRKPKFDVSNPEPGVMSFSNNKLEEFSLFGKLVKLDGKALQIHTGETVYSVEISDDLEIYRFENVVQYDRQTGPLEQFVKPGDKIAVLGEKKNGEMVITQLVFTDNDFGGRGEITLGPRYVNQP